MQEGNAAEHFFNVAYGDAKPQPARELPDQRRRCWGVDLEDARGVAAQVGADAVGLRAELGPAGGPCRQGVPVTIRQNGNIGCVAILIRLALVRRAGQISQQRPEILGGVQNAQDNRRARRRVVNQKQAEARQRPEPERIGQQLRAPSSKLRTGRQSLASVKDRRQQPLRRPRCCDSVQKPVYCMVEVGRCLRREVPEPAHAEALLLRAMVARTCAAASSPVRYPSRSPSSLADRTEASSSARATSCR